MEYQGFAEPTRHLEAQSECQKGNANLASFVSEDNIKRMADAVRLIDQSSSWYFWTGLRYTISSGTWSFIDGADITFAKSKVTLPEGVHQNQCVMINGDEQLSVTHCNGKRRFICQQGRHPTDSPIATSTG